MNVFLLPYTWARHFALGFVCSASALLAWWGALTAVVWVPFVPIGADGALYLGALSAAAAGTSVYAEVTLRREGLLRGLGRTAGAVTLAVTLTLFGYAFWTFGVAPIVGGSAPESDGAEATLMSLRWRLAPFVVAGLSAGVGALAVRWTGIVEHLGAGIAAGLAGAIGWYVVGYSKLGELSGLGLGDPYLGGAVGALCFGWMFGLLAWGIPDSLYAGWLRVVTDTRHGHRIPVDAPDGKPRERFVGHFPRGLDLFLPADDGVLELHVSVLVNAKSEHRLRGLTLQRTVVARFLERVDLRYDPRRPAPLETRLSSGDRLHLGPADNPTIVEFVMLPKEER